MCVVVAVLLAVDVGVMFGFRMAVSVIVTEGVNVCVEVGTAVLVAVAVVKGTGRISVEVATAGDG